MQLHRYSGRIVIAEIVNIHSTHRKLITKRSIYKIDKVSTNLGYKVLRLTA